MDDYPLTLTSIIERAERFHTDREVVPAGPLARSPHNIGLLRRSGQTACRCAGRLGVRDGDLVATLLWNQSEHLELYFAIPVDGRGHRHAESPPVP